MPDNAGYWIVIRDTGYPAMTRTKLQLSNKKIGIAYSKIAAIIAVFG